MEDFSEIPISENSFDTAKWVWKNLVPKSGQSDTVQGELLRCVEKLAWEAQNNGNGNWGPQSDFEKLLQYLEDTLCAEPDFDSEAKQSIKRDVKRLRRYKQPYTDEDLYDRLTEHVVAYFRLHPQLIPKPHDPSLLR
jgi:hypothetical protein